ncbi:MAG: hypothetical protein KGH50_03275 [Candidatus Micrarchaeota archaeon]|nr:hypothetical protein [Candidatus Micrarchaeota archaeon]
MMPKGSDYERFFRQFFVSRGNDSFDCRLCGRNEVKGVRGALKHMKEVHFRRTGGKGKSEVHFDVILGNVEMNE